MADDKADEIESQREPRPPANPLAETIAIMKRLRGPDGCPWDREQTFDSIKRHTLEETYEVFDAIERRAWPDLQDELGDLLLQVLFYAQMAAEAGYFDIGDVAENLNAKLIRRHPHVFPVNGKRADAADSDAVLRNWERIKREEKSEKSSTATAAPSGLDDIPRTMPAALEAVKIGSRAAKVGFDWPGVDGIFDKLQEEIAELKVELACADAAAQERVNQEFGDILFTLVNLARHLSVDTESALRLANAKFRSRFRAMEASAGSYDKLSTLSPAELDASWNKAKQAIRSNPPAAEGNPSPLGEFKV